MLDNIDEIKKRIRKGIDWRRSKNDKPPITDEQFELEYQQERLKYDRDIPSRYSECLIENIPKQVQDLLPLGDLGKTGIYIWGGVGVGKTYTLYALKKYYAQGLHRLKIRNVTEILNQIKKSFDDKSIDILDIYDAEFDCLALDDLGAEKGSEWAGEQIYRLINYIYENENNFIITSNLSLQEISSRFGEIQGDRIASRIAEMAEIVELKGNDRRI